VVSDRAATFKLLVGEYRVVIVCDALKTHEAGAREAGHILLAGCWAHCSRRFEDAKPDHPEAVRALELIGKPRSGSTRSGSTHRRD
jgi:hypothetical protein